MSPHRPRYVSASAILSFSSVLLLGLALILGLAGPGCREQSTAPVDRNAAPQTILVGVPGDSTTTFYRVSLYWTGNDPDGEVVGYEWAITDSLPPGGEEGIQYNYTTRTDSTFVFTVEENREVLGHRFYVRAIDNEGKRDPTPAYTFFTVRNSGVPEAWYTRAQATGPGGGVRQITSTNTRIPSDTIPAGWSVEFAWTGRDTDLALNPDGTIDTVGQIAGYTYHLTPLELNYIGGTLADTAATYSADRLASNTYVMYIRSRDDAGLSGLDPEIRSFVWNYDPVAYFTREAVEEGSPDSFETFYASTAGTSPQDFFPHAYGDTLPLTVAGVKTFAHVRAFDPDPPFEIAAYQARQIRDSGFWVDLQPDLVFRQFTPQWTGSYKLMARAMDAHGRWDGTPDTLLFHINLSPRFTSQWEYYSLIYEQRPMAERTYPSSNADTLKIRFAADDPDFAAGATTGVEFTHRFDFFPLPGGGQGNETIYRAEWQRGTSSQPWFVDRSAVLQNGQPFIPGTYVLSVQARESFATDANRQRYGYRITERKVRFYLD